MDATDSGGAGDWRGVHGSRLAAGGAALGAFFGAHEYDVYCVGRLEGIDNSRLGTEYVPDVPPGDRDRRTAAVAGFAVAAVGVAIAALALVLWGLDSYAVRARATREQIAETRT